MSVRMNLARWLIARSDIEAALYLLQTNKPGPDDCTRDVDGERRLETYIEKYWPALFDHDAYGAVYVEAGRIEAVVDPLQVYRSVETSQRYQHTLSHLRRVIGENYMGKRWLDFGCNRGIWAAHLYSHFGGDWTLYDIDQICIDEAQKIVRRFAGGGMADNAEFSAWPVKDKTFDVILAFEVLEHVLDPVKVITDLEAQLADDGLICISVPYGPFEYSMWMDSPTRNREHIREFGFECLLEMLGARQQLNIQYVNYGRSLIQQMELGHWIVSWRKTKNAGPIGRLSLNDMTALRSVPFIALPGLNN